MPIAAQDWKLSNSNNFSQSENSKEFSKNYGNMQSQSVLAILRSLKMLEEQGGNLFFSEPEIDLNDLFKKDERGYGYINILSCEKLITKPSIYSAFLLYMLSYLYETLPEIGDTEIPKFAFFFDEAHMLFDNISKELLSKIELTVRLIRSKGVGVFFIIDEGKNFFVQPFSTNTKIQKNSNLENSL